MQPDRFETTVRLGPPVRVWEEAVGPRSVEMNADAVATLCDMSRTTRRWSFARELVR